MLLLAPLAAAGVPEDCIRRPGADGATLLVCVHSDAEEPEGSAVSVFGNASGCEWSCLAVSGTGDATGTTPVAPFGGCRWDDEAEFRPCVSASDEAADGFYVAFSIDGNATGRVLAISTFGNATNDSPSCWPCGAISVTGNGRTFGGCSLVTQAGRPDLCGRPTLP